MSKTPARIILATQADKADGREPFVRIKARESGRQKVTAAMIAFGVEPTERALQLCDADIITLGEEGQHQNPNQSKIAALREQLAYRVTGLVQAIEVLTLQGHNVRNTVLSASMPVIENYGRALVEEGGDAEKAAGKRMFEQTIGMETVLRQYNGRRISANATPLLDQFSELGGLLTDPAKTNPHRADELTKKLARSLLDYQV